MATKIKKILDKMEPLIAELDRITGKDNLLVNSENIQRIKARIKADTANQIFEGINIDDAIKQGELRSGAYDEWAEAEAYKIIRNRINILKKKYRVD